MYWILTPLLFTIIQVQASKHCKDIVKFEDKFYKKEFIADGTVSKPFFMTYLDDRIVFSEDSEPLGNTSTYILDLKTKNLKEIFADKAVVNGVDSNGTIYIGQDGGLFTYDEENGFVYKDLKDIVFYSLQIKGDRIYYTDFPYKDLYVYENGVANLVVSGLGINDVVFDDRNNMFYFNKTGVYVQMVSGEVIHFDAMEYDEIPLVGLTYNVKTDSVYATSIFGVFKLDLVKKELKRISMKIMFDIVFDRDGHIIYADEESIVRLRPTELTC